MHDELRRRIRPGSADGEVTAFPMAVKCAADETVVFSWITWPDKATRDTGTKRVMDEADRLQSFISCKEGLKVAR